MLIIRHKVYSYISNRFTFDHNRYIEQANVSQTGTFTVLTFSSLSVSSASAYTLQELRCVSCLSGFKQCHNLSKYPKKMWPRILPLTL
jgi:hypothetical protein